MKRNERGITLIALIITVIVLLILAGTAISIAVNGGDIFTKSADARTSWNSAVAREESEINNALAVLNTAIGGSATATPEPTATATPTPKQWEFATNGDKDSSGTVTVGDLIKPKNTNVASEQFYVIGDDGTNLTLLAEKLVKVSAGDGQYTTQVGTTSQAGKLAFDSTEPYTNVYADLDTEIKGKVETYANHLAEYLTLENVETVEGGSPVSGVKGRLMWGTATGSWDSGYTTWTYTSGTGEVATLLDSSLSNKLDIVYGPSGAKLNYWLGSPVASHSYNAWSVIGDDSGVYYNFVNYNYVYFYLDFRPSSSYSYLQVFNLG